MNRGGKKTLFITGGVFMLVAGVVIGAFLVLQSMRAEGQFVPTERQTKTFNAEITQPLLSELERLRTQEEFFSEDANNLTQKFITTLSRESEAVEDATAPAFVQSVVFPFLQNNKRLIIPPPEEVAVQSSVKTDVTTYRANLEKHLVVLAGVWQEIIHLSPDAIDRERFSALRTLLKQSYTELEKTPVPLDYTTVHRNMLRLSTALRQVVTHSILQDGGDPLRGILATALLDDIGDLGREIIYEFSELQAQ